ncbi:MAG: type II toxin-antitoxin system prevent-host-death family antitoxin [Terriglobales bacterium]|jgi:prevent-host-death family protein
MKTVNIHQAKTQLSKLIEEASKGESFIIAKAGKPVVRVTALSAPTAAQVRRLGFMAGQISVPDDFDRMGQEEIERIFGEEMFGGGA